MIGNWLLGAYSDDATGAFSHCAASATYKSGIVMLLAVHKNYSWSMGFSNPAWSLNPGNQYPISFTVDRVPTLSARAIALSSNQVGVPLADSVTLFNIFRHGRLLTVFGGNQTFQFVLTDTSFLLPALLRCVRSYAPAPVEATNPFISTSRSTPPAPPIAPQSVAVATQPKISSDVIAARRLEATQFLANVLSAAGIFGYRMLGVDELSKLSVDAAWTDGKETGAVNILPQTKNFGPNEAEAIILAENAKTCTGKFMSGSKSGGSQANDIEAFTSCSDKSGTVTTMYSIVPKNDQTLYVIRTISTDQPGSSSSSDHAKSVEHRMLNAAYKIAK